MEIDRDRQKIQRLSIAMTIIGPIFSCFEPVSFGFFKKIVYKKHFGYYIIIQLYV